jgi:ankyrin repeat protein
MKRIVAAVAIWLLPASGIAADGPLLKAAEAGDLDAVNALLAKGVHVSETSDIGIPAAMLDTLGVHFDRFGDSTGMLTI